VSDSSALNVRQIDARATVRFPADR